MSAANGRAAPPAPALNLAQRCKAPLKVLNVLAERVVSEFQVELPLLRARWRSVLLCLVMQYVHGMCTQLVYRFHVPAAQRLPDTGFALTPELGPEHFWVSETLFGLLFGSFVLWIVSPFYTEHKSFYTVVVLRRLLVHLVCCQTLRALSFFSTILPGPAHHCLEPQPTARREWVRHWTQHFVVDVSKQTTNSCGDLIFSSHMTFILSFVICYTYYGKRVVFKVAAWALAATLAVLIICSRKHYTVDILIAWYVVPLVFLALERRYTTKERNDADALKSGASVELQTILVADIDGASGQEPADGLLQPIELEAHAGSATGTVYEAIVSPQHVRKGSHSRRPTNEGLMALSGRKTERTAAVANPSPLSRVQSKPKLGP